MKKLIFLVLLVLSISTISKAQYYPYIPRLVDIPNTWDSTQRFKHVIIDSSLSLYNLNGNRWFYANGADSSLVAKGQNLKLTSATNYNIGFGTHSNGIGSNALTNNIGNYSNGFGTDALRNNIAEYSNGFGQNAVKDNTGGSCNAFGYGALQNNTGIGSNNAFGNNALQNNTGQSVNAFGNFALYQNTGNYSIAFGHYALNGNKGDYSLGLGNYTKLYTPYTSNKLYIDNLDRGDSLGSLNGSLIQGNFSYDSSLQKLRFNAEVSTQGDILPTVTRLYNLGTDILSWKNLYVQNAYIDSVKSDIVFLRDVVIDSNLTVTGTINGGSVRPYKVYTVLLTQTDTLPPVATVLENTIGDIVWTRLSTGLYRGTLQSAFPNSKFYNPYFYRTDENGVIYRLFRMDDNIIEVRTDDGGLADGLLTLYPIEIRVYP